MARLGRPYVLVPGHSEVIPQLPHSQVGRRFAVCACGAVSPCCAARAAGPCRAGSVTGWRLLGVLCYAPTLPGGWVAGAQTPAAPPSRGASFRVSPAPPAIVLLFGGRVPASAGLMELQRLGAPGGPAGQRARAQEARGLGAPQPSPGPGPRGSSLRALRAPRPSRGWGAVLEAGECTGWEPLIAGACGKLRSPRRANPGFTSGLRGGPAPSDPACPGLLSHHHFSGRSSVLA